MSVWFAGVGGLRSVINNMQYNHFHVLELAFGIHVTHLNTTITIISQPGCQLVVPSIAAMELHSTLFGESHLSPAKTCP